jgi:hypothetical protein
MSFLSFWQSGHKTGFSPFSFRGGVGLEPVLAYLEAVPSLILCPFISEICLLIGTGNRKRGDFTPKLAKW